MDQPTNETKLTLANYAFFIKTKIQEHKKFENEEYKKFYHILNSVKRYMSRIKQIIK